MTGRTPRLTTLGMGTIPRPPTEQPLRLRSPPTAETMAATPPRPLLQMMTHPLKLGWRRHRRRALQKGLQPQGCRHPVAQRTVLPLRELVLRRHGQTVLTSVTMKAMGHAATCPQGVSLARRFRALPKFARRAALWALTPGRLRA